MALSQSALLEVLEALKASDSTEVIRRALEVMLQQLIDAEATAFIGAEPHERTDARVTQRNGTSVQDDHHDCWRCRPLDHQAPRRDRSSLRCSSVAAGSIRRCSR